MKIVENIQDVSSFIKLRAQAKFMEYSYHESEKSLKNSLYTVFIYSINIKDAIGCGRVVGDGICAFFLKDIIVDYNYRGMGYGDLIMKNIEKYILSVCADNAYVGLMSTKNREKFYEKYSYIRRPTDEKGCGMQKYIKENLL